MIIRRTGLLGISLLIACAAFMSRASRAQDKTGGIHPTQDARSLIPQAVGASTLADPSRPYVPGELLVKFRSVPSSRALAAVGAQRLRTFAMSNVEHWRLAPGMGVEQAIRVLHSPAFTGVVDYAEPNYIVHAHDFPNDILRGELWGLHNIGQSGGTVDADIDAPEAWQLQTGDSIVVAVIDTGIDYNHEDLAANIWGNPGEIADNGIDDDGNGYIDDVHGWDFVNNDNDPMDDHSHGTHTAGTIGAIGNNGMGVAGVAWNVRLMPL